TGQFPSDTLFHPQSLGYGYKPGWDIGAQFCFQGRGGFLSLQLDFGLSGKYSKVSSDFIGDTDTLVRDGTYNTTWLTIGVQPELTFRRDGRLSVFAGPYMGFLLGSRLKGTQLPNTDNKLFRANNDFKKIDFGLLGGFQYRMNPGKKEVGGKLGLRFQLGLKNLDNLYSTRFNNAALYNGRVTLQGVAVYYSVNLLKL
ncbi:MAG: PorT family protein, partial [Saprospiraceae bacterium]|nr:PorT family protein [Saprospiraceae bacterium]